MTLSEQTQNKLHYDIWVAVTGGGPNWEYMRWIETKKREWLTYCIDTDLGVPVFSFTDWLNDKGSHRVANERKNIMQPSDWWAAFEAQAKAEGMTLSAWIGEAAKAKLPPKALKKLLERPPAHRPKASR
jgi:hypothetical protein